MNTYRVLRGVEPMCRTDDERKAAQIAKALSIAYFDQTFTVEEFTPKFQYTNNVRHAIGGWKPRMNQAEIDEEIGTERDW